MGGLRHASSLPSTLLHFFFLLLLSPTCVIGKGTREDSNCASAIKAEAPSATAASTEAELARARYSRHPLAANMKCLGLLQLDMFPGRVHGYIEEAKENNVSEEMEKEGLLQAGHQSVGRPSLFRVAAIKLNHSDDNTSRGLQPDFQSLVSSHGSAVDANTTAFIPFWSSRSWLNEWIWFRQLSASLHPREMVAFRYIRVASMRSADLVSWALFAPLLFVTVLVCVCLGIRTRSNTGSVSGTIERPRGTTSGTFKQPQMFFSCVTLRHSNPSRPPTLPRLPTSRAPPSMGPTSALSLPVSPETNNFLCLELVVPRNCESFLRIHINTSNNSFHVSDVEGTSVLRVELQVGKTILHCEGFVLAQYATTPVDGGVDEIQLLRANGEYYGKLVKGGLEEWEPLATWIIQTCAGVEWFFLGHVDSYAIEVRDKAGKVVSVAHQIDATRTRDEHSDADKAYLLRIAPTMDVSIAMCGILAINHLL